MTTETVPAHCRISRNTGITGNTEVVSRPEESRKPSLQQVGAITLQIEE